MGRVLIACEESQTVCKAFRELGHEAYSCDIQDCSGGHPEWHIQGDAIEVMYREYWDMVIAHPPCTYMSNSGVRWLYEHDGRQNTRRWMNLIAAMIFFNQVKQWHYDTGRKLCLENPIPHKHAVNDIADKKGIGKYTQLIQPWQFGHGETKATCLWLYGLPELKPTEIVEGREQRIWKLPPSADRQKLRSKSFEGIAKAMAEQWGKLLPI